jgi:hypothetical protein
VPLNPDGQTEKIDEKRRLNLEANLDRSAHELQLLANIYHEHGKPQRAQELYRTLLKIRQGQNRDGQ